MAAEALRKSAAALGHEIKIETQGPVGAKNRLSDEEIGHADSVIIAADAYVDAARFAGKRLLQTTTKAALRGGRRWGREALPAPQASLAGSVNPLKISVRRPAPALTST